MKLWGDKFHHGRVVVCSNLVWSLVSLAIPCTLVCMEFREITMKYPITKIVSALVVKAKEETINVALKKNVLKGSLLSTFARHSREQNSADSIELVIKCNSCIDNIHVLQLTDPYEIIYNDEKQELRIRTRKRFQEYIYAMTLKIPLSISDVRVRGSGYISCPIQKVTIKAKGSVRIPQKMNIMHHQDYVTYRSSEKLPMTIKLHSTKSIVDLVGEK